MVVCVSLEFQQSRPVFIDKEGAESTFLKEDIRILFRKDEARQLIKQLKEVVGEDN